MKKMILVALAGTLMTAVACNNDSGNNKKEPMAEVLNTDTVTLSCDADRGSVKLVFLGEQGHYDRVTVYMDSTQYDMMPDAGNDKVRFSTADKSMTLQQEGGNYSFYKDTTLLFSCFAGLTEGGREFKTASGVVFVVEETHPTSASLSTIRVTSRGLKEVETDMSYTDVDPVKDIFLADINNDGFEELYIVTEVAGSGGYAGIIGLSSNSDKSTSTITVPELVEDDMKAGKLFEGYQGHDKIYIENKQLVREFPVYKAGDNNATPSGGTRKVVYSLTKGEASWMLTAATIK